MRKELLSFQETAKRFEIRSDTQVQRWKRIYLEECPEGLYEKRRDRNSHGGVRPANKLKPEVEEDLIAEVQRLRAKNAYLKKTESLGSERGTPKQKAQVI